MASDTDTGSVANGLVLNQPRRLSLAESIADTVAGAIASGQLKAGERVVELTLADQLGVSRVPVREALKVLHAQGIIAGGGHRGYRVSDFDAQTVQNVFELRLMLEKVLLRDALVRVRAGKANFHELHAAIEAMKRAAKLEDRAASLLADMDFHRGIVHAAGNDIAATLWETIARHVLIIFSWEEYRDDDLDSIVAQHQQFLHYIEASVADTKSETELEAALTDHILLVNRMKRARNAN